MASKSHSHLRISPIIRRRAVWALSLAALYLILISPLAGQAGQDEEDTARPSPPWMKYFYVTLGGNLEYVSFPLKFYSAIKVVDNVYDYPHSSIEFGDKERWAASRFSTGGSLGFAFLAYEKTLFSIVGDVELSYFKSRFADVPETCGEVTVYYDASLDENTKVEVSRDLNFTQIERGIEAISLMVKFGANFITGLPRLFFLIDFGLTRYQRTFVSGVSANYDNKLDFSELSDREGSDFGAYKGGGKWVRRNYPISLGMELRYYLFNNFSLNAGWLVHMGRQPSTIDYGDGYTQTSNNIKMIGHGLVAGLSIVF